MDYTASLDEKRTSYCCVSVTYRTRYTRFRIENQTWVTFLTVNASTRIEENGYMATLEGECIQVRLADGTLVVDLTVAA